MTNLLVLESCDIIVYCMIIGRLVQMDFNIAMYIVATFCDKIFLICFRVESL